MRHISFKEVDLKDGFWLDRYNLNKTVSIDNVYKRFEETGRFDALRFKYDGQFELHRFYDSDVAKWIEAVAYLMQKDSSYKKYESVVDELIEKMKKNQRADGYLNSYFQQRDPENIFTRRDDHELYCAGHLIEAAIAYYEASGKKTFLDIMFKYIDFIERAFITEKFAKFTTPGHEEIEIALLRLYNLTNDKKHLSMAEHFIYERGKNPDEPGYIHGNAKYTQNNLPATELEKAEGHAVRATYFYTALADYAEKTKDTALLNACNRLFDDIMTKMYITGGLGSTRIGESFTVSFDLPNLTAYAESCAAIGLMMFSQAMLKNENNSRYANIIEQVMYNGFLSSTSLDGKSFFYENPLEICMKEYSKETSILPEFQTKLPIPQRKEVFNCSCCPPNINRTIAAIGNYIFSVDGDYLFINQYISSTYQNIEIETDYPAKGKIKISGKGLTNKKLALRKPDWCENFSLTENEIDVSYVLENGYIIIDIDKDFEFVLNLDMPVRFIKSNRSVRDNAGKVAVMRGPVVYCAEQVDNGEDLFALIVDTNSSAVLDTNNSYGIPDLLLNGYRDSDFDELYVSFEHNKTLPVKIKLVPYYTFANRGISDMIVWLRY